MTQGNGSCNSNAWLAGLVSGVIVGAAVGILLAPASGKETRGKLKKKYDELRGRITEMRKRRESGTESA